MLPDAVEALETAALQCKKLLSFLDNVDQENIFKGVKLYAPSSTPEQLKRKQNGLIQSVIY